MKRKDALMAIGLCLAAFAGQAATVLMLGHIAAPDHPRAKASELFARTVKAQSQGRITVEVHGNAELGDAMTMLKALQNGTIDISPNTQGPVATLVPEFNAFGMPFLFSSSEAAWQVLDGPLGQELARRSAANGLILLGCWENGIRHFSNSLRPLLKPADFTGLVFRTPEDSVTIDIVEALGGKTRRLNYTKVHDALRFGVVSGQENPLVNMRVSRFDEVQKFISLTAHKYEVTPFVMAKPSWDALSEADRQIVMRAAREATRFQRDLTRKMEVDALSDLTARGVRIDRVDPRPFIAATTHIYDKWYASPIGDYVRAVVRAARGNP